MCTSSWHLAALPAQSSPSPHQFESPPYLNYHGAALQAQNWSCGALPMESAASQTTLLPAQKHQTTHCPHGTASLDITWTVLPSSPADHALLTRLSMCGAPGTHPPASSAPGGASPRSQAWASATCAWINLATADTTAPIPNAAAFAQIMKIGTIPSHSMPRTLRARSCRRPAAATRIPISAQYPP